MINYKECNCDEESWEEIVIKDDNHYDNRTVLYFHCSDCGIDFRVEDFFTGEEVFYYESSKLE
ncbi:MAG TPA: hypothetical protein VKY44_06640 [Flavobacterium sp.]|nr:hypothetical protein [Flavobacterium sp.]